MTFSTFLRKKSREDETSLSFHFRSFQILFISFKADWTMQSYLQYVFILFFFKAGDDLLL